MIITPTEAVELIAGRLMVRTAVAETLLSASKITPIRLKQRHFYKRDEIESHIDHMTSELFAHALQRPERS